jgi:hypothetical protein
MSKNQETTQVQNPCFLAASDYPILIYRQQSGLFRQYEYPYAPVRVGMKGMADAGAIVPVKITQDMVGQTLGLAVQIEFKHGEGKQSPGQKKFEKATIAANGIYKLIYSEAEFRALIESMIEKN